jgi:hypothetical protein
MSRKVFTAGEVLAAADVNSFLMDQSVMSFAGTAARGSAIPTPVTGMTTYLEDTKDLQVYDGSAYASPFGLTHLRTTSFTSVSTISVNDVFNSQFDNYKLVFDLQGSSDALVSLRLRVSGADNSSNVYTQQGVQTGAGTIGNPTGVGTTTSFSLINVTNGTDANGASMDLLLPFVARRTRHSLSGFCYNGGTNSSVFRGGEHNSATSFTGFSLITSAGNITGTVTVYGYRKA